MPFFKNDNGELQVAPNSIHTPVGVLLKNRPADLTRTVDGWHWYDTGAEARTAYGLGTLRAEIRREILDELDLKDLIDARIAERREDG